MRMSLGFGLVAAIAIACSAYAGAPVEVPLVPGKAQKVSEGRRVADYTAVAQAIIAVLNGKLALPVPAYTMELYSEQADFEQALVTKMKFKPETARTTASFAKAFVGAQRVIVNEPALAQLPWPDRVETLAHEIVHTCQLELAGNRSLVRYQWLVEGFAEWSSHQVAHELGVVDFARSREDIILRVRAAKAQVGLAQLADLDSLEQWITERKKRSFDAMYPYSFLVTEFLIERHSRDKAIEFFRRRRDSSDAAANFKAAFGEDLSQFQAALDAHLDRLIGR